MNSPIKELEMAIENLHIDGDVDSFSKQAWEKIDLIKDEISDLENEVKEAEDNLRYEKIQRQEAEVERDSNWEELNKLQTTTENVIIPQNLLEEDKAEIINRIYRNCTIQQLQILESQAIELKSNSPIKYNENIMG